MICPALTVEPEEETPQTSTSLKQRLIQEIANGDHGSAETTRQQIKAAKQPMVENALIQNQSALDSSSSASWTDENGVEEIIELQATPEARRFFDQKSGIK